MTESWDKYLEHKDSIMQRIRNYMGNYVLYPQINKQVQETRRTILSGQALYDTPNEQSCNIAWIGLGKLGLPMC